MILQAVRSTPGSGARRRRRVLTWAVTAALGMLTEATAATFSILAWAIAAALGVLTRAVATAFRILARTIAAAFGVLAEPVAAAFGILSRTIATALRVLTRAVAAALSLLGNRAYAAGRGRSRHCLGVACRGHAKHQSCRCSQCEQSHVTLLAVMTIRLRRVRSGGYG